MGLLDGLLGGVVGAEMATVANGLIEKHGGVQCIVAQMEQQGWEIRSSRGWGPAPTCLFPPIKCTPRSVRT